MITADRFQLVIDLGYGPNHCRYSPETTNDLTTSAEVAVELDELAQPEAGRTCIAWQMAEVGERSEHAAQSWPLGSGNERRAGKLI